MKVLQYNIWDGCHDEDRYAELQNLIVKGAYDAIGFNELTGWTTDMFTRKMTDIGYDYSHFFAMQTSNYPVGIASKQPIKLIFENEDDPFHHGMLHVETGGIQFLITHFSPFLSEHKEREATYIANYIKDIEEPLMVMGDLNTLSPLDQAHYDEDNMLEQLRGTKHAWNCQTKDGMINYEPMNILLKTGLMDTTHTEMLNYSMPTKVHDNYKKRRFVRLDYMLANEALLPYKPVSYVIQNSATDYISDHYPIEGNISLSK